VYFGFSREKTTIIDPRPRGKGGIHGNHCQMPMPNEEQQRRRLVIGAHENSINDYLFILYQVRHSALKGKNKIGLQQLIKQRFF